MARAWMAMGTGARPENMGRSIYLVMTQRVRAILTVRARLDTPRVTARILLACELFFAAPKKRMTNPIILRRGDSGHRGGSLKSRGLLREPGVFVLFAERTTTFLTKASAISHEMPTV